MLYVGFSVQSFIMHNQHFPDLFRNSTRAVVKTCRLFGLNYGRYCDADYLEALFRLYVCSFWRKTKLMTGFNRVYRCRWSGDQ